MDNNFLTAKRSSLALCIIVSTTVSFAQKITKNTVSMVSGTVCPLATNYSVSIPKNMGACHIKWTASGGTINGKDDQKAVSVDWSDTPGATASISVTFYGCEKGNPNENAGDSMDELILSVKGQSVPTYYNSLDVDICSKNPVRIQIPPIYVQGTGGIGEPPLQEATYVWTLPSGWAFRGVDSGCTALNSIDIYPTECAKQGNVLVRGAVGGGCQPTGFTSTASISLNVAVPYMKMGPQGAYTGAILGKIEPVSFAATVSPSLQCVSSYKWSFPPGWKSNGQSSPVTTTTNTITITPSGTPSDAGAISVMANLACGGVLTTSSFNVPFIPPQITGPGIVCTRGNFMVQNVAPGVNYSWSSRNSRGLSVVPSSADASTGTFDAMPGFSGNVPVNVNLSFNGNVVSATSKPFVGTPCASISTLIYPSPSRAVNPIGLNAATAYHFKCDPVLGAVSYNWILPSGFSFPNGNGSAAEYITTSSLNGSYTLYCQVINTCGASYTNSLTINITGGTNPTARGGEKGTGGGKKPPITLMAASPLKIKMYPNPTIHSFTLNVMDTTAEQNPVTEYEVRLFDQSSREVLHINSKDAETHIPVDHLPPNLYYILIQSKEGVLKEELLIDH